MVKISIVTAVFNRAPVVRDAVASVQSQIYRNIEHIVVDGASTDNTLEVLRECLDARAVLISEPDQGIYDALNKGFTRATGDVVGVMHSDDFFADDSVLADVAAAFVDPSVDAVYGDLDYVSKNNIEYVVRHWQSAPYSSRRLAWGWMPPHPTLFIRKRLIDELGGFDTRLRIAADYDFILRIFSNSKIKAVYIPRVLVKMRVGGESNRSLRKIFRKTCEDWIALRRSRAGAIGGIGALIWKNLSKLRQFL